jgi:hypothetical protein
VNGIEKGKVLHTQLSEKGVYVQCVICRFQCPKNSSFRLIIGFSRQQEVSILQEMHQFLISGVLEWLTDQGFRD